MPSKTDKSSPSSKTDMSSSSLILRDTLAHTEPTSKNFWSLDTLRSHMPSSDTHDVVDPFTVLQEDDDASITPYHYDDDDGDGDGDDDDDGDGDDDDDDDDDGDDAIADNVQHVSLSLPPLPPSSKLSKPPNPHATSSSPNGLTSPNLRPNGGGLFADKEDPLLQAIPRLMTTTTAINSDSNSNSKFDSNTTNANSSSNSTNTEVNVTSQSNSSLLPPHFESMPTLFSSTAPSPVISLASLDDMLSRYKQKYVH
jgi:hypothetical protein